MTTVRKAATDLRVGDYFWYNRELRRVTDVDARYVFGEIDPVVVAITTSTGTVFAPPASTFDVTITTSTGTVFAPPASTFDVAITTSTGTVFAPPASTFDVEVFEEDPCAT